jgi:hypothetical protein
MSEPFGTWRDINNSVGNLGRNLHDDVVAVQEMLNDVPMAEGGSYTKLKVDGACRDRTIGAIQKFQLHHFGWSGADGLVEPQKQTHRKLNEYYGANLKSTQFTITRSVVDRIGAEWEWEVVQSEQEWYYKVEDNSGSRAAIYWHGIRPLATLVKPRPAMFRGRPIHFNIKTPGGARVTDLSCNAIYATREEGWLVTSHLILSYLTGAVALQMDWLKRDAARHPTAADRLGRPMRLPPSYWRAPYRREGPFQFVTELG